MISAKPSNKDARSSARRASAGAALGRARLVLHADCASCGYAGESLVDASALQLALAHSASTGHVVVLNGTTDLPEMDDDSVDQEVT